MDSRFVHQMRLGTVIVAFVLIACDDKHKLQGSAGPMIKEVADSRPEKPLQGGELQVSADQPILGAEINEGTLALQDILGSLISQRRYPYRHIYDSVIDILLRFQCEESRISVTDSKIFNDPRFVDLESVYCDQVALKTGATFMWSDGSWHAF